MVITVSQLKKVRTIIVRRKAEQIDADVLYGSMDPVIKGFLESTENNKHGFCKGVEVVYMVSPTINYIAGKRYEASKYFFTDFKFGRYGRLTRLNLCQAYALATNLAHLYGKAHQAMRYGHLKEPNWERWFPDIAGCPIAWMERNAAKYSQIKSSIIATIKCFVSWEDHEYVPEDWSQATIHQRPIESVLRDCLALLNNQEEESPRGHTAWFHRAMIDQLHLRTWCLPAGLDFEYENVLPLTPPKTNRGEEWAWLSQFVYLA